MKCTGGGRYDPDEAPVFFTAGNSRGAPCSPHTLMALNDLGDGSEESTHHAIVEMERRLDAGGKLLLDSGIFNVTNEHKRAHGITMDEALRIHPTEIDGFDKLWGMYVDVVKRYQDRLWGFIELDQGGANAKRETRARIEAEGLVPIPVYHPIVDGWDYFDELASQYDRICVGNVVQATRSERQRILATLWERHRAYPHLWIHVLGLTPNQIIGTYYFNSCDSSSFVSLLRWRPRACPMNMTALRILGAAQNEYSYEKESTESYFNACALFHSAGYFLTETWRVQHDAMMVLQGDKLPPVEEWEGALR